MKKWSYLASNYEAWAQIEEAEDLSRKDQNQKAIKAFAETIQVFEASKRSFKTALTSIESPDERQNALDLIQAADFRSEYCQGRMAIEEAKILDKRGDHLASSEKYATAARTFEKIGQSLDSERERNELILITVLSRAWQKMTQAEAEATTQPYTEASLLFEQARDLSQNEKTKALSLGHSRFCRALEAGTRFIDTGDPKLHAAAVRYLEAASSHYLKASNEKASDYAKATGFLFDAYLHLNNSKKEKDPDKKAKLLSVAEKVLQTSANVYTKAEHPEKREQVLTVLKEVREERELAVSLNEILKAPAIVSTSVAFPTPTPTYEKPVGLDRFEHGDIQTNLTTPDQATVGEELPLRLDLVNVAKNFALMVRLNNLIPPTLKVTSPPAQYVVEDGSIDMKGRRLDPLKVETIKMGLEASKAGDFTFTPQLLYVDDIGQFRTHQIEPATLIVRPKLNIEFKSSKAEAVFNFLTDSFTADYMRRRLALDNSGWRTLMDVIKHTKIPKSSVYGRGGHRGPVVMELENRGLVETRTFTGERGRGGEILKIRVYYEKETVKRLIDHQVAKIKEK
jgi:hypothetical protein